MAERFKTGPRERAFFDAWEGTLRDFVSDSSLARDILERPESKLIYEEGFLAQARRLMKG